MFSSLRAKLIAVSACVMTLALVSLSIANLVSVWMDIETETDRKTAQTADSYAENISSWVDSKTRALQALGPAAMNGNPQQEVFMIREAGGFDNTYAGYPDKRFVTTIPTAPGYDPTSRGWYKAAVQRQAPIMTDPYIAASTKRLVMTIAIPFYTDTDKQNLRVIIGVDMQMENVVKTVSSIKPTPHSFAFLINRAGLIVSHPQNDWILKNTREYLPEGDAERMEASLAEKKSFVTRFDDREYMLFPREVRGTDWILVMMVDKAEEMSMVYGLVKLSLIVVMGITLVSLLLMFVAVSRVTRRLLFIRDAMTDIVSGEGDLTRRLDVAGTDELAQIATAFNRFVVKIAEIMANIRSASQSVRISSQEIASGNMELSRRTESQAGSLEQTVAAMEQLTSTVKQNAENASEAHRVADSASGTATSGGDIVNNVVQRMEMIQESSKKIVDIISVIDGIAFQTNILALNAAVEAARAGEQGRGFAVVASEVRTLAQRSATAAKEIKDLIDHSVREINEGSQLVQQAGETMVDIVSGIRSVSGIVAEISTASHEQSQGIGSISEAMSEIDQTMQQNAALVEQAAAAAGSLLEQSGKLADIVATFRLDAGESRQMQAYVVPETHPDTRQLDHPPSSVPLLPASGHARKKDHHAGEQDEDAS